MGLNLHYLYESAGVRAIKLTADQIGVHLKLMPVHLKKDDNFKSQFLRFNPQELPPTFYDHSIGLALWESKAIVLYMIEKFYDRGASLYPKDPQYRGRINQILFFDEIVLEKSFRDFWYPQIFHGKGGSFEAFKQMEVALDKLEAVLSNHKWAAGPDLTVADLVLLSTIANYCVIVQKDISRYKNTMKWYKNCEIFVRGYEENIYDALKCKKLFELLK